MFKIKLTLMNNWLTSGIEGIITNKPLEVISACAQSINCKREFWEFIKYEPFFV